MKTDLSPASHTGADDLSITRRVTARLDVYGNLKPRLRGLVHAWSAVPIGLCSLLFVILTPTLGARFAVAVYGLAVTGMLSASAFYHRLNVSAQTSVYLRRLDHSMIGVAVAGTYTPVLVLNLEGGLRVALIAVLWAGAIGAMIIAFGWPQAPSWLRALIYVVLGFAGVAAMPTIWVNSGVAASVMIIVGAVLYLLGATSYATRRPNPFPKTFGFHEVFHSFVVAAVISHFAAVMIVVIQRT